MGESAGAGGLLERGRGRLGGGWLTKGLGGRIVARSALFLLVDQLGAAEAIAGNYPQRLAEAADVGGDLFEETILAWDEKTRWTYRIDRCTAALAHAQVESTELSDAAEGGTRVRWILASDPREGFAAAREALPGILETLLGEALANLERHLTEAEAP